MADSTISGLPAGATLTGAELVPTVQGGVTVQTTTQQIANLASLGALGTMASQNANAVAITGGTATLSTLTSGKVTATGAITGSSTTGAYSYGNLGYSDVNIFQALSTSVNGYAQVIVQNTSSGTTASADYIVSNNSGTATTFYGNFGMNSSTFTGTGSQNLPNAVYLTATSGDLVLGTTTSNAIHFSIGNAATDQFGMGTAGQLLVGGAAGTSGQVLQSGGPSAAASWVTLTGGGNVSGPGSSTSGFVPVWNNTSGTLLAAGLAAPSSGTLISSVTALPGAVTGTPSSATYLRGDGTWNSPSGSGTVTTVSVTSANGFAGTVATATSTPAITLSTTVTGILKGNGTAISAATAGTDYVSTASAQTWSLSNQTFYTSIINIKGSSSGLTALASLNASTTSYTATFPNNTGTLAELNFAQTWTAAQTFTNSDIALLGSSTGATTFTSANASATNYTATFPANTGTIAELNFAQTWTALQTYNNSSIALLGSSTGATTFASANASATNYTMTVPAGTGNMLASVTAVPVATGTPSSSTFLRGDGTWASAGSSVIPGYIWGLTLSNDGTTPTTVLDIAAGSASDSTNAVTMTGTAFTKTVSGTWVAGTGNAGMGTGLTVAANTWYHVYSIINGGNYDVYFDTSTTAANKPASTTAFRYIGSFKTNGSSQIIAFFQLGQDFLWAASVADISAGGTTSAALYTLSTPLGIVTKPLIFATATSGGSPTFSVWSPVLGSGYTAPTGFGGGTVAGSGIQVPSTHSTNTSSQLYLKVSTASTLTVTTLGYTNPHVAAVY